MTLLRGCLLLALFAPRGAIAGLCTYTVTNNTDAAKSDLHVLISGTGGGLKAPSAVTVNPEGCPAVTTTPSGNRVTIDWGAPCVGDGKSVTFNVTLDDVPCGSIAGVIWTPEPVDSDPNEVFVSYVWDYPDGSRLNDLAREKVEGIARGFYDRLKDVRGWTGPGTAIHGNADAVRKHWDETAENDHVDQADFGFFVGHGRSIGEAGIAIHQWAFHDLDLGPRDANRDGNNGSGLWGDTDLEWVTAVACRSTLDDEWIRAFGGLHLLLGWNADPFDFSVDKELGRDYAWHLDDLTVVQSWYAANERHAKATRPGAVAIDPLNFRDYIWGVQSGPRPDPANYVNAQALPEHRLDLRTPPPVPPPAFSSSLEDASGAPRRASAPGLVRWLTSPDPVVAPQEVAPPARARRYEVLSRQVDRAYVDRIASGLCRSLEAFCTLGDPEAEDGPTGDRRWRDGDHRLLVDPVSGGFSYIDTARWMLPGAAPPGEPPGQEESRAIADRFLATMGLLAADARHAPARYREAVLETRRPSAGKSPRADTSRVLHTVVTYERTLGSDPAYPVAGPGGTMSVHVGPRGRILAFFYNGWRELATGSEVPLRPPREAERLLSSRYLPEEILVPLCGCESLAVQGSTLGYVDPGLGVAMGSLEPYYLVDALCRNEGASFGVRFAVLASAP